jgi:hypothetical protein
MTNYVRSDSSTDLKAHLYPPLTANVKYFPSRVTDMSDDEHHIAWVNHIEHTCTWNVIPESWNMALTRALNDGGDFYALIYSVQLLLESRTNDNIMSYLGLWAAVQRSQVHLEIYTKYLAALSSDDDPDDELADYYYDQLRSVALMFILLGFTTIASMDRVNFQPFTSVDMIRFFGVEGQTDHNVVLTRALYDKIKSFCGVDVEVFPDYLPFSKVGLTDDNPVDFFFHKKTNPIGFAPNAGHDFVAVYGYNLLFDEHNRGVIPWGRSHLLIVGTNLDPAYPDQFRHWFEFAGNWKDRRYKHGKGFVSGKGSEITRQVADLAVPGIGFPEWCAELRHFPVYFKNRSRPSARYVNKVPTYESLNKFGDDYIRIPVTRNDMCNMLLVLNVRRPIRMYCGESSVTLVFAYYYDKPSKALVCNFSYSYVSGITGLKFTIDKNVIYYLKRGTMSIFDDMEYRCCLSVLERAQDLSNYQFTAPRSDLVAQRTACLDVLDMHIQRTIGSCLGHDIMSLIQSMCNDVDPALYNSYHARLITRFIVPNVSSSRSCVCCTNRPTLPTCLNTTYLSPKGLLLP